MFQYLKFKLAQHIMIKPITNALMQGECKVWWSPGRVHFALRTHTVTLPRWVYPHQEDGPKRCSICRKMHWMERKHTTCHACMTTHQTVQGWIHGPSWWPEDLRKILREGLFKTSFYTPLPPHLTQTSPPTAKRVKKVKNVTKDTSHVRTN